ncbi:probable glutathione S-transferase [Salvia miltiorrhiza]|uniref:probable glutathione S-transferase n=1 Tax=Salvia miltiorrhiza TaxID=226208 RepID=UPI0025AB6C62|nr:probable glutathione S-transferase [Salvia miltiorrhiza]
MSGGDEWILLDFWSSMFGSRVRIALAEKGIVYERREEEFPKKSEVLLEMNPTYRKIPVLIHNGKPICESWNIVQYIDEVCCFTPFLLPTDPYDRAKANFWAHFIDHKLHPVSMKTMRYETKAQLEEAEKEMVECVKLLQGELGEKPYFGGERVGYLDVILGGFCSWFCAYKELGSFSILDEFPKLKAWTHRCMQRHTFSASLPDPDKLCHLVRRIRNRNALDLQ